MSWTILQDSSSPWGDIWGFMWSDFTWWESQGPASGSWISVSGAVGNWIMVGPSVGTWIDVEAASGSWIALSNPIDEAWGDIWGYIWGQPSWIKQNASTGDWGLLNVAIGDWLEQQPISTEGIPEAWGSGLWGTMHWDGRITIGTAWVASQETIDESWGDIWGYSWGQGDWVASSNVDSTWTKVA